MASGTALVTCKDPGMEPVCRLLAFVDLSFISPSSLPEFTLDMSLALVEVVVGPLRVEAIETIAPVTLEVVNLLLSVLLW